MNYPGNMIGRRNGVSSYYRDFTGVCGGRECLGTGPEAWHIEYYAVQVEGQLCRHDGFQAAADEGP